MYNIIIDLSYIFYKSYSISKHYGETPLDLTTEEGKGFLIRKATIDICKIVRELNSDKVFICCDSPSFRKTLYPDYKNRGEKEPGFVETQLELIEILKSRGINVIKIDELEADDTMTLICNYIKDEIKIVVTGDEDLRTNIDFKTYCYHAHSTSKKFYYFDDRQLKYKIKEGDEYEYIKCDPFLTLITKIVKGCSTDHVPGIAPKGFRTKKVEEICQRYREIDEVIDVERLHTLLNEYFECDIDSLYLQLMLVCLQEFYMPENSVETFYKVFENKTTDIKNWDFREVLKGTKYITEID